MVGDLATLLLLLWLILLSGHCFEGLAVCRGTALHVRPIRRSYEAQRCLVRVEWMDGMDEMGRMDRLHLDLVAPLSPVVSWLLALRGWNTCADARTLRLCAAQECTGVPCRAMSAWPVSPGPSESPGRNFQARLTGSVQQRALCA